MGRKIKLSKNKIRIYEKIAENATMDCYYEHEQISGWACLLDEAIHMPCQCRIGTEKVILEKIEEDDNCSCVVGLVRLGKSRMRVLLQDISLDDISGVDKINAYNYWCKSG